MNVGIDLDGTITANPKVFKVLMQALVHDSNTVYIISAVMKPNTCRLQQKKIDELGINRNVHYHKAIFINGGTYGNDVAKHQAGLAKRDLCRDLDIELFIEDKPAWAQLIGQECQSLMVVPRQ